MLVGVILFLVWMALEVVVVAATIAWGFENNQWKDIEEPKYRMLLDLPIQGYPGRGGQQPAEPTPQLTDLERGNLP